MLRLALISFTRVISSPASEPLVFAMRLFSTLNMKCGDMRERTLASCVCISCMYIFNLRFLKYVVPKSNSSTNTAISSMPTYSHRYAVRMCASFSCSSILLCSLSESCE